MSKFILGKKLGMTTIYAEKEAQNVTLVECVSRVSVIRTGGKDGYDAVQIEMPKTKKRTEKKEFRFSGPQDLELKVGDEISVEVFEIGDVVNASGTTKAKGFQGGVKRHGFGGAPKSHGHKHDLRAPGSIGAQQPQHVIKGKRMAGRMGGGRSTTKNLKVVYINSEKKLLGLKGAVPGVPGSIVEIYTR